MNIERVDPVVLIHQSPDVERAKGDRERHREKDEKEDEPKAEQPAPPTDEAQTDQPEEVAPPEGRHAPAVVYEPLGESGARKDETEQDPTIDYRA